MSQFLKRKMLNDYDANNENYKTISILSQCCQGIGTVHLAKHLSSGQMVAIKKFNMDKAKDEINLIEQEIILTRQLKHLNIIKYHIAFVSGPEVCVISPLMGYGSCRDLINTHFNDGLPENAIALITRSVLDALDYIHKRGIIHRAIRASHILISASGLTCLSGFRYSCPIVNNGRWQKQIHSFPASTARNLNWLSPEVLEQNLEGYNERSDIYSFGMLICELANGSEPYSNTSSTLMLTEKVRGCIPPLLDCTTLPDESEMHDSGLKLSYHRQARRQFSDYLHELSMLCLQRNPYERPTTNYLLTHPFYKLSRRTLQLCELLKPALPLSDKVAYNNDEMECFESLQKITDIDLYSCDWDF
ncbi:PREDICTED: STE20-related kinase adapter protein alpha isoform X2 [Nicrophorus vespilloides]|uniref:STE20-related kinase adapter protein alpha isoform X2 n=1 Tax=Nicrophorus vespilloides TaxID=110193 RepID=A0ABM1MRN3_NICVS|nr:PREDICTED: STE20-related kinase adapter protein alpha isoform X2 [Nicrophorus vespilloides]